MANKKLLNLLAQLQDAQEERKRLEQQDKALSKDIEELQKKLVPAFEADGMQSINLDGVGTFYLEAQTFPKVEDNPLMLKWFRNHKMASLIKETVNWQTLRGEANSRLKDNLPLPDGISTYNKTVVKLRGTTDK